MTRRPARTIVCDNVLSFSLTSRGVRGYLIAGRRLCRDFGSDDRAYLGASDQQELHRLQVGSVKVVYNFSAKSSRFAYVLSRKAGSKWSRVRSVSNRGSFRGSHTMTVKTTFGSKPITASQYRLELSSSANSVTLSFSVVPPGTPKPQAGRWRATSLTGPVSGSAPSGNTVTATELFFDVASSQQTVSAFGFSYEYSGPIKMPYSGPCSGSGDSAETALSPISNGQFFTPSATGAWTDAASGTFHGTFDSPTTAHGTAQMNLYVGGSGCFISGSSYTGTFNWTATRQG